MSISRTTRKRKPRCGDNCPRLSLQESGHVEGTGNHERRGREPALEKQNSGLVFTHTIPNQISLARQGSAGNSWFVSLFQGPGREKTRGKIVRSALFLKIFPNLSQILISKDIQLIGLVHVGRSQVLRSFLMISSHRVSRAGTDPPRRARWRSGNIKTNRSLYERIRRSKVGR